MHVVETRSISKNYKDITALDNVSFSIRKGEIFGLLGENGAGKTTLLRIISTLIEPTDGNINILGSENIYDNETVKEHIGVVTNNAKPIPTLTVKENLNFFYSFYIKDKKTRKERVKEIVEILDLTDYKNKQVELLSSGNQQKVAIAKSIGSDPKILILDEPMNGLDVATQKVIKQLIISLKEDGKTIIFTSHNMSEIEELAEHICILNKGSLVFDGNLNDSDTDIKDLEKLLIEGTL